MKPEEVINRLREKAEEIFKPFPVDVAYVYGSVARGTPHPFSDVDVAVVLEEEALARMSPTERLFLELRIERAIEDIAGIKNAEVRIVNRAPAILLGAVTCEGKRIYCRNDDHRVSFETYAWSRYFDYRPVYLRMQKALIRKFMEERGLW